MAQNKYARILEEIGKIEKEQPDPLKRDLSQAVGTVLASTLDPDPVVTVNPISPSKNTTNVGSGGEVVSKMASDVGAQIRAGAWSPYEVSRFAAGEGSGGVKPYKVHNIKDPIAKEAIEKSASFRNYIAQYPSLSYENIIEIHDADNQVDGKDTVYFLPLLKEDDLMKNIPRRTNEIWGDNINMADQWSKDVMKYLGRDDLTVDYLRKLDQKKLRVMTEKDFSKENYDYFMGRYVDKKQ